MKQLSLEAKEAILKQALDRNGITQAEVARRNNIGYSTLQKWLSAKRAGLPLSVRDGRRNGLKLTQNQKLSHLLATTNIDETALGIYCREQGIYTHQLTKWKEELVSNSAEIKLQKQLDELRLLKSENQKLKKELRRKDKALAETSALLVLKKKVDLIWGDPEDD